MLCIGIFGVHNRWCAATLVNYILVAIFLWCTVSSVRCIFGVMYMHFWYAMHRHLWWCLIGAITIVQCIFDALFLGIGCNTFLVLRLWCYALSATSRRLATAVAHLRYYLHIIDLYLNLIHSTFQAGQMLRGAGVVREAGSEVCGRGQPKEVPA